MVRQRSPQSRQSQSQERRQRWREHAAECARLWRAWEQRQRGYRLELWEPLPDLPELPDDLHDLTCGARTRAGTPVMSGALAAGQKLPTDPPRVLGQHLADPACGQIHVANLDCVLLWVSSCTMSSSQRRWFR